MSSKTCRSNLIAAASVTTLLSVQTVEPFILPMSLKPLVCLPKAGSGNPLPVAIAAPEPIGEQKWKKSFARTARPLGIPEPFIVPIDDDSDSESESETPPRQERLAARRATTTKLVPIENPEKLWQSPWVHVFIGDRCKEHQVSSIPERLLLHYAPNVVSLLDPIEEPAERSLDSEYTLIEQLAHQWAIASIPHELEMGHGVPDSVENPPFQEQTDMFLKLRVPFVRTSLEREFPALVYVLDWICQSSYEDDPQPMRRPQQISEVVSVHSACELLTLEGEVERCRKWLYKMLHNRPLMHADVEALMSLLREDETMRKRVGHNLAFFQIKGSIEDLGKIMKLLKNACPEVLQYMEGDKAELQKNQRQEAKNSTSKAGKDTKLKCPAPIQGEPQSNRDSEAKKRRRTRRKGKNNENKR